MAARLAHRGPDDDGSFLSADGRLAVGFRRLAVIDPAGSHQPMTSADGNLTVAFNGEIYNFRALRGQLAADGAVFRTAGDTEVLLHLYPRHGDRMLEHLQGMFAFVLYDAPAGRLLLARDRFGQKPLWYAVLPDRLAFASEAKALLSHPKIDRRTDADSITHFLTMGYVPAPRSVWPGVRKVQPGHAFSVTTEVTAPAPYWSPRAVDVSASGADLAQHVRGLLGRVVEDHMVSDVPLGALLSGGIDSAIVVALMSAAAGRVGGVRTFTAGFGDEAFDERPAARLVAADCKTDHTELTVAPAPAEMLDQLIGMYDEPFGDSSALPTWLICRAAREHVTVALVGDGGDEVFAGYDRYRALHLAETMGRLAYLGVRLAAWGVRPWTPHDERRRLRPDGRD